MKPDSIIEVFQNFRMKPTDIDQFETTGKQTLSGKMQPFINDNKPIDFVMLGYPMKSINNRDKVLGILPDLGEELSLQNFANFNNEVKKVYSPGVNVTLVSDGYIFSDLMKVPDGIVQAYEEVNQDLSKGYPITWYNMKDFYSKKLSTATIREKIMQQFGITPEELERRIMTDPNTNWLYKGMIRFMNLDMAIWDFPNNSQLQKAAKKMAREMMFRNEAYSSLMQTEFKDHIRISMHQTVNDGKKFSFQLIPSPKANMSPWHCSILIDADGQFATIHKKDAVEAGYHIVNRDGRPHHFAQA